jgi:glycerol-3-phosphate dehydrogenase
MSRSQQLSELKQQTQSFDVVVIGAGITGAGIALEAAASGLKTLVLEQQDFAWGSSSRSSKMVHGGLRYLAGGHLRLARSAVQERQRMLVEAPGLVTPMHYVMPHYKGEFPGPRLFRLLLRLYNRFAGAATLPPLQPAQVPLWVPGLNSKNLAAASVFTDAVTDDTRLVQRLLAEARAKGALCLNYVKVLDLQRNADGQQQICGLLAQAEEDTEPFTIKTPLVMAATGAWSSQFSSAEKSQFPTRPLRGSHLVLPWQRLPVDCSVTAFHPQDRRPVFAFPWLGQTVLGTTDLDHNENLAQEPAISQSEVDYLMAVAAHLFPASELKPADVLSSWAGVRPVISTQEDNGSKRSPSGESREHKINNDNGLITIAGGKLTTFRVIAREALKMGLSEGPKQKLRDNRLRVFNPAPELQKPARISHKTWTRLRGYYGPDLPALLAAGPLEPVLGASVVHNPAIDLTWAELCYACQSEQVKHLDDLLLRRTRLGLLIADGATVLLPQIKSRCRPLLGWSESHWQNEVERYRTIWRSYYSLPPGTA